MRVFKQLGQDALNIQTIVKNVTKELIDARDYIDYRAIAPKFAAFSDVAATLFDFAMDMEFLLLNCEKPDKYDFDTLEYIKDEIDISKYLFFMANEEVKNAENIVLSYSIGYLINQLQFLRGEILKDLDRVTKEMQQKAA